ncbi:MAG: Wadjet anti-phage system protein JetD domain-containing protein, partial [Rhodothermales bacterium]
KKRAALLEEASHVVTAGSGDASPAESRDGYVVELEERRSRRYGVQLLPRRIYFGDEDGYARFLGREREVERYRAAVETTRRELPELLPWLERHAPRTLPYIDEWADLLKVVRYFADHPRPNLYARELPLDVDTKFVERHEGVLRQLLDFLLPEEAIDAGASDFARRYGLRYDESLVRMRVLDPSLPVASSWPADDLSIPIASAARLDGAGCTVVISENKMTFLTLPRIPHGLGIWGGGFQIDVLRAVEWLRACDVLYWGDLDAHGFVMLSRLRAFLPEARSVMMDVETFECFREYAVSGPPVDEHAAPHLHPAERAVFRSLAQTNLRLEQERIPQAYVVKQLVERG